MVAKAGSENRFTGGEFEGVSNCHDVEGASADGRLEGYAPSPSRFNFAEAGSENGFAGTSSEGVGRLPHIEGAGADGRRFEVRGYRTPTADT